MNGETPTGTSPAMREDQARIELAMAAATAERANRPRGLVMVAGLMLLAAIIYAGSGYFARAATLGRVEAERTKSRQVLASVAKVQDLRDKQASRGLISDPRVGKAIEELATAAGVTQDATGRALIVPESEATGIAVPGVAQKKYTARVTGQDPKALMQWLVNVQSSGETRGVEISMVALRPDAALASARNGGWSMDVEFVRWETRK